MALFSFIDHLKKIKYYMEHKHFGINFATDKDKAPPEKLTARLDGWKRIADSFYRGSEVTFIQIVKDWDIIRHNHAISQQTGSLVTRGYVPIIDEVYFLQIGICLENLIK